MIVKRAQKNKNKIDRDYGSGTQLFAVKKIQFIMKRANATEYNFVCS